MARRTKKEVEQGTINIKYAPMNITGDTAFKCLNDDWGVVAFDIRRSQLENSSIQFGDKELQHNCLYFLMGRVGLIEMVYVGQAKKRNGGGYVLQRLREHAKSQTEPYREIWTRAIVVTGKEDTWGPTELNALEHIFYNEIPPENSLNGNNPNAGLDDLEQFSEKVKQIELYLAILKVGIFSGTDDSQRVTVQSVTNEYSRREDLLNGMARIPEIVTPHKTVVDMVDLLPADVWNPETTFLDPACKGGEFLKEIYDRLMETESLKAIYPNDIVRSNHILSNQIFGISISEVSKKRTTDSLNGFGYNIKIIPGYIDKIKGKCLGSKEDGTEKTMFDIIKEEFNRMKFDVVIGNPPYNKGMDLDFVNLGFDLSSKYCCMITPAKWQTAEANQRVSSKMTYGEFRKKLVPHMSHVVFYPNSTDVFNAVYQIDGISYFILDKRIHDDCEVANIQNDIFRAKGKINDILMANEKELYISRETVMRDIRGDKSLLNIGQEIIDYLGQYESFNPDLYKNNIAGKYKVWINNLVPGNQQVSAGGFLGIGKAYISEVRPDKNQIDCYFSSNSYGECLSYLSYINCKFTRFFLSCYYSKLTGVICKQCFRFVPAPPSGKFDHIYTDQELYDAFNLPQKYRDVIEAVIKERK